MVVKNKPTLIIILAIFILLFLFKTWGAGAQGVAKVADLPVAVYDACCALGDDGNIYVFGGFINNTGSKSSSVVRFNPNDKSVNIVADLGNGYEGGWAVNYNGKIYVGGGYYGTQPSTKIFIFDPSDNSIDTVTSPSAMNVYSDAGHGTMGAFLYNNNICEFWGCSLSTYQTTIKKYDPTNNSATTISKPPAVTYYSVSSLNNLAYIVGYYDNLATNTGVLVFDPTTNSLNKVSDFSYWAGSAAAFGSDGMLYLIGGKQITGYQELKSSITQYDPINKTSAVVGNLPVGRAFFTASKANNGKIYVFGGMDSVTFGSGITAEILEIDPSAFTALPSDFVLSGALDGSNANLTWTAADGASNYILERSTDGTNYSQINQTTARAYTDPNLAPGTYYYRATARNNFGSSVSNIVVLTAQPNPPPDAPVLSVTLENTNNAALTWTSVTGATNYILEKSTNGTNFTTLTQTASTSYTDPNLETGTFYYRVSAAGSNGTSVPSNVVSVTIQPTPPPAPRDWVFWPTGGQYVEVDWIRENIDLTGSMVQLWREDTVSGIWMPVRDISDAEKESFTWLDTNVTSGLNYKYQIRVYNPTNWSWKIAVESDWAVQERPFPAPGGLQIASSSDTSATVTWSTVNGAGSYQVETSADGGNTWNSSTVGGPPITVKKPCMVKIKAGTHSRSQWSGILRVQ